jgi:hypothetical protein
MGKVFANFEAFILKCYNEFDTGILSDGIICKLVNIKIAVCPNFKSKIICKVVPSLEPSRICLTGTEGVKFMY